MRVAVALGLAVALTACARNAPPAAAPTTAAPHGVGYVRMDELVRKHPLYGQLARYDENIEALNLSTIAPRAVAAAPELARREAALQAQLVEATKRTNDLLQAKGKSYQDQESAAIAEALRQAGGSGGTSVAAVTSQVERTAGDQVRNAGAQAQRDLETYRKQLEAQDAAQVDAVQRTLAGRADRTYRAKMDELNTKEAALSLKLATDDAPERLSLRTKLTSLALDDSARSAAKNQLDGLDKKEADAIAAQHSEDQATLAALQAQLGDGIRTDMQHQVADIHARSVARYQARQSELRGQFSVPGGPLLGNAAKDGKAVAAGPNLPAPLRAKIQALHDDYTKAFQKDAGATIADFNKTRDLLKQRYDALRGLNDDATRNVQSEIVSLQRKREDLYEQMVAQIGREVKTIAQQRGVSLVLSNVSAPAGGIDLTDDALKDIETLHE